MTTRGLRTGLLAALLCVAAGTSCGSSPRPPAQKLPMELLRNHPRRGKEAKTTAAIMGVVLGSDGKPVDFALVAAVNVLDDPEDGKPPYLTTSKDRGKFELSGLPPGNYGLTVTAPVANAIEGASAEEGVPVGAFAGVVAAQASELGPPMLVRFGSKGMLLKGHVTTEKGDPVAGGLVRAVRESPFEGDHFFAKTGKDGAFAMAVPLGRYFLVGQADGRRPARVDLDGDKLPADIQVRLAPSLVAPTHEALSAWVASAGGVIGSVDSADTADLKGLREIVGNARIVALGEASYTGSEVAKLKTRMFQYLVEQMGFSVLLLEASQADVRALNDYVLYSKGTLAGLVADLGYFSLDTEEMAALFSWMRSYNLDWKHRLKLRVAGIEAQRTALPATNLELYLARVDKALLPAVETTLLRLRVNDFGSDFRKRPADEQDKVSADLALIAEMLEKNERKYVSKSSGVAFATAREDARALVWAARVFRDESQRGPALADLAKRAISPLPGKWRVAIWAHNAQVSKRRADGGMGALLAEAYRGDYVSLGFTFYQGWVRAWDFTTGPTLARGTKLFRLPPAASTTLEGLLDGAGAPMFFADVDKAPAPLVPWFETRLSMRSVGSVFVSDRQSHTRTVVREAFDGLVFVKKQTTTHFAPTGRRPGQKETE